ncbi:MAG: DUF6786 family protein [Bacteroidota bacterium]
MKKVSFCSVLLGIILQGCQPSHDPATYQRILNQLKAKTDLIELTANEGRARLMISPELQGRIMTSTAQGLDGMGNGWFNEKILQPESGLMGGIGGEDRLWIGPLGSQYSFYYQQIKPLSEENWAVPATMDAEPYQVVSAGEKQILMQKDMHLTNFIGTDFQLRIDRHIHILEKEDIQRNLDVDLPLEIDFVAFESRHNLINRDTLPITHEGGLVSIWSAGMFAGTDGSTVIIPLQGEGQKDDILQYMGKLGSDRFRIKDQTLFFKADGKYRSKIGIPPALAPALYGCYTPEKQRLSIVQHQLPGDSLYANSEVSMQESPYQGEVIPIYNNGPMSLQVAEEASFFELESTSPLRPLSPGDSLTHFHAVYHFVGNQRELDDLAAQLLGTTLEPVF